MIIDFYNPADESRPRRAKYGPGASPQSTTPILYSHGGSRHFVGTPRNLTDEAAKNIGSKGGLVGLQFGNTFSNRAYYHWRQKGRSFGDLSGTLKRYALSRPSRPWTKRSPKRIRASRRFRPRSVAWEWTAWRIRKALG
jgi:hypothetical protein